MTSSLDMASLDLSGKRLVDPPGNAPGRYLSGRDLRWGTTPSVVSATAAHTPWGVLTVTSIYSRKNPRATASRRPTNADSSRLRLQLGEDGAPGSVARWT